MQLMRLVPRRCLLAYVEVFWEEAGQAAVTTKLFTNM